ncbi:hypothetical protein CIK05_12620 [Bdellovibrio sp. qaytius]|nr:hypothetical protein CIK05_12620 [Bdellovibrio sp. qaytius]
MKKTTMVLSALMMALVNTTGCSNTGTKFALPQQNEQFSGQTFYNNKVDMLFVVDNSKSMLQYQQRLAAKVGDMVDTLNSLGMDYRIGVTTSTMAKTSDYPSARKLVGNPVYLTSANVNLLADRIIVGESGSDLERSLDAMKLVTSPDFSGQFLRSDALFSVIFISDEVDQSSEFGNPDSNDFVNYLNTRKPLFDDGTRGWIANYIGILTNQSCDSLGGHVSIGTQFNKLVDASNGVKSSICAADLSSAVANIKARIISQLTSYRFGDVPNKATIQVTVGGKAISEDSANGWTLETEVNGATTVYLLKFHGEAIPAANEQVTVNYKPNGAT